MKFNFLSYNGDRCFLMIFNEMCTCFLQSYMVIIIAVSCFITNVCYLLTETGYLIVP